MICMHVHGIIVMCMLASTSIGWPQRAAERMVTAAASAAAAPCTPALDPLPFASEVARTESPAKIGVGSECVHGCPVAAVSSALRRRCSSL